MSTIRARAQLAGDVATVRCLMTHPMETGQRKNKAGQTIPAHFIKEVVAEHNGNNVMTAHWSAAISRNPYLSFQFSGANSGDTLTISWVDNKGEQDSAEVTV